MPMTLPPEFAIAFGELEISKATVVGLILVTLFTFAAVAISSLTLFKGISEDE